METQSLISIHLIDPNPYQPRQAMDPDAVAELADNIKRNTLLQIPTARQMNGHYQLAFGHRRLAAYKLNGENCMPLIIRDLDDLQMFELGVAENIKRRDLNPIEKAEAMKRYMQEFDKNSIETGEFFGVSEEQVRGTVRLTNLVPAAQTALATGKINITTARTLLSMQKVASIEAVIETVSQIEKHQDVHPDEVIENVIERKLKDVKRLWVDHWSGKPRGGNGHAWLLDMKNFPNKLLPELTPVDMAMALNIQDDQHAIAAANTWAMFRRGQLNQTKEEIEALDISAEIKTKVDHLLTPPTCTACPFYTKILGAHFCGMQVCFERKTSAWHTNMIQMASKNLGIAIYQKSDGTRKVLDYNNVKLFNSRHKGLRLFPKAETNGGHVYQHGYQGVDTDVFFVVATGEAIEKLAVGNRGNGGGKMTDEEKIEMRKMKIYRLRRKELMWEFTGIARSIFKGIPAAAVDQVKGWKCVGIDERIRDEWEPAKNASEKEKAEFDKRELVWKMIGDVCSHYHRQSMADILEGLQEKADEWNIKIPESLVEKVQQWDAEIEAVSMATPKKANGKKGK